MAFLPQRTCPQDGNPPSDRQYGDRLLQSGKKFKGLARFAEMEPPLVAIWPMLSFSGEDARPVECDGSRV